MQEHVYPNERRFYDEIEENTRKGARWTPTRIVEELKLEAKAAGLWNLFLPESAARRRADEPRVRAAVPRSWAACRWASEVFNCSAPDTGNMETIERYGTPEQKKQWLEPLLARRDPLAFAMTEPAVASSDATNIQTAIRRDGDDYVINGRKWWTSGAGDPRCKIYIVMGKTDPTRRDAPAAVDDPGAVGHARREGRAAAARCSATTTRRTATWRSCSRTCACPRRTSCSARAAASRSRRAASGPGRIHHCMRSIGLAERALELMCKRAARARRLRRADRATSRCGRSASPRRAA